MSEITTKETFQTAAKERCDQMARELEDLRYQAAMSNSTTQLDDIARRIVSLRRELSNWKHCLAVRGINV